MLRHSADGDNSEYEECQQAVYSLPSAIYAGYMQQARFGKHASYLLLYLRTWFLNC